jgi:hypothetical protein
MNGEFADTTHTHVGIWQVITTNKTEVSVQVPRNETYRNLCTMNFQEIVDLGVAVKLGISYCL